MLITELPVSRRDREIYGIKAKYRDNRTGETYRVQKFENTGPNYHLERRQVHERKFYPHGDFSSIKNIESYLGISS